MTSGGDLLVAGDRLGNFRIVEALGGGGARPSVYLGEDEHDGRVVLTVISPKGSRGQASRARLEAEVRNTVGVEHPNVVPVLSVGTDDDRLYFTTPYLDGVTLAEALDRPGSLDAPTALRITASVASALDALHARGIVHGDVSPKSIVLEDNSGEGGVYLADLGLASLGDADFQRARGADPAFAAPERIQAGRAGQRADVYALGRVLGRMLGDSGSATSKKSRALDAVIARAVALDPAYRYASAGDFAADAMSAFAGEGRPISRPGFAASAERRRIAATAAPLGIAFAAVNAAAGWIPVWVLAIAFVLSATAVLLGDARQRSSAG